MWPSKNKIKVEEFTPEQIVNYQKISQFNTCVKVTIIHYWEGT